MSHDRGCFRCFEDHPKEHSKICSIADCPYKLDTQSEIKSIQLSQLEDTIKSQSIMIHDLQQENEHWARRVQALETRLRKIRELTR